MNFLSHYYLHRSENDNYLNIGLTLPDVLGLHNRHVRLSERFISGIEINDDKTESLINGVRLHINLDKYFHKSEYFKEKVNFIQTEYFKASGEENIAVYYAHILLEILIDRYLLIEHPNIAEEFYSSYKEFDFNNIIEIFLGLKNFDSEKFLDFTQKVAYSDFLYHYTDNFAVIGDLKRVTTRIGLPIEITTDERIIADFIGNVYLKLEGSISKLFKDLKEINFLE